MWYRNHYTQSSVTLDQAYSHHGHHMQRTNCLSKNPSRIWQMKTHQKIRTKLTSSYHKIHHFGHPRSQQRIQPCPSQCCRQHYPQPPSRIHWRTLVHPYQTPNYPRRVLCLQWWHPSTWTIWNRIPLQRQPLSPRLWTFSHHLNPCTFPSSTPLNPWTNWRSRTL